MNPRVGVITAVVLATAACTAVGISENDLDFRVESRIQSVRQDAVGSQALTCSFWVVLEVTGGAPGDGLRPVQLVIGADPRDWQGSVDLGATGGLVPTGTRDSMVVEVRQNSAPYSIFIDLRMEWPDGSAREKDIRADCSP